MGPTPLDAQITNADVMSKTPAIKVASAMVGSVPNLSASLSGGDVIMPER
jgi:hypothetical protein